MISEPTPTIRQPLERIHADDPLPVKADVVIIGAGIVGASAAWELASRGVKVVLLEKGFIGAEQSSRNWGWCRQQGRDPKELELARLSLQMWPGLSEKLRRDIGFKQCGVTFLTDSEAEAATWVEWIKEARPKGIVSRMLSAEEAQRVAPGNSSIKWIAGLSTDSDGRAEPSRVAPFLAQAARELGASVVESCAVRDVERTNGRISGVHTEKGFIGCTSVVVAAGAWTALFLRKLGVAFPQAYVNASVAKTLATAVSVDNCLAMPAVSVRSREDSGLTVAKSGQGTVDITPSMIRNAFRFFPTYLLRRKAVKLRLSGELWRQWKMERAYMSKGISPFESRRVLDPAPDLALLHSALDEVKRAYPTLSHLTIEKTWGGVIDSMPDAVPVISAVDSVPGLVVASGFSGHGFGVGPGAGSAIAALVLGNPPPIDLSPFRYSRITDGTKLKPHPIF
ncbi:NAD(P)/FAD-dependent oxidoreductase [Paraburkholderia tropica]|uniref:Glycine/D-amino acid oxidase n=1 Tax=Paraburkholderia tropica TaxID=92647 RepID=A0AAQ1JWL6_9BURK|nr:FAD-binding oxidoreductase [Paraburkholderia tropica]RQN38179.1 FAD-binding oxidoreductase [Paraburkholderia tropica]SEK07735.1 Glycine/D-amino acid oxidase [Paraburkholderia tropica]